MTWRGRNIQQKKLQPCADAMWSQRTLYRQIFIYYILLWLHFDLSITFPLCNMLWCLQISAKQMKWIILLSWRSGYSHPWWGPRRGSQSPEAPISVTYMQREGGVVRYFQPIISEPRHALPLTLTWPAEVNPARPGWTWHTEFTGTVSPLWPSCSTDRKAWKYSRLPKAAAFTRSVRAATLCCSFLCGLIPWGSLYHILHTTPHWEYIQWIFGLSSNNTQKSVF